MKKPFVFFFLLLVQYASYSQCDKKVVFTCDKATELKNGVTGEVMPIQMTITLGAGAMQMVGQEGGREEKVQGTILEWLACDWTKFLEEGSSRCKVSAAKEGQSPEEGILEVENKNGTLTITMGDPTGSSKVQLNVKSYEILEAAEAVAPAALPASKETKKKKKKA